MGDEVVLFESEEEMSLESVAAFLRELADNLAENEVVLQGASGSLTIELPDRVTLEVEVEEETDDEGTERSLEIEIEWYENRAVEEVEATEAAGEAEASEGAGEVEAGAVHASETEGDQEAEEDESSEAKEKTAADAEAA